MKILIISHEYPPIGGGGANACMHLAREYSGSGHSVNIITAWYKGLAVKETISDHGTPIHVIRVMAKRKNMEHCGFAEMMDFLLKAIRVADKSVKNAISSGAPYDICQIFFGIPSGPAGYLLKRRYGLPYVIRFGGGDIPGFQDRFGRLYSFIGPALRRIWKRADGLVANSEGLRELARGFCDKYPYLCSRTVLIPIFIIL